MKTMTHHIELADMEHADMLAPLFDAYRVFYGCPSSLPDSRHFLFERMLNHESVVFMAQDEAGKPLGFAQIFPYFHSVALQPVWILSDLYVVPAHRRQGIAKDLVQAAIRLVRDREDWGVVLKTAKTNEPAQKLLESMGFTLEMQFQHYFYRC